MKTSFVHESAIIEKDVSIGNDSMIWHFCHIRKGVTIEDSVSLGKGVYVDPNIIIHEGTRIQNGVSLYAGVEIRPWVFIGPHVVFTNDKNPRAGKKKWTPISTTIETGASIGAGTIINTGIRIGAFSLIGAGSIILKDIPDFAIARGNPTGLSGYTCACANSRFEKFFIENCIQECCYNNLNEKALKNALNYAQTLQQ